MGSRGKRPKRPQRDRLPDRRTRSAEETDTRPAAVTTRCTGNSDPRSCRRRATSADDGTSSTPRDEKSSSSIKELEPATRRGKDRNRGDQPAESPAREPKPGRKREDRTGQQRTRGSFRPEERTEQHGCDAIGGRENERQVAMTVAPPGRRSAARGRKQEERQERRPGEARGRQQMLRSISSRVSLGHTRGRRRDREGYRPKPARSDARFRTSRGSQGANEPGLRDRSNLDVRAAVLVDEDQEPTRPTAARGRNVRWRAAERHANRENATQLGVRNHAAERRSDQKDPNDTGDTRATREERSVDSGRGTGRRDTDRSRTRRHHRGERAGRTSRSLRAVDEKPRRLDAAINVPAAETSRAPQRNAPDTRKILMTRLTCHTKS